MLHLMTRLMLVLVLIVPFTNVHAANKYVEASIGGKKILIPAPKEFSDPSLTFPKVSQFGEAMTASTNRLLALFISDDDVKAMLAQTPPQLQRYFMVQTLRVAENAAMSTQDFSGIKNQLKNQYKKVIADNAAKMQLEIDRAVDRLNSDSKAIQEKKMSLKMGELKIVDVIDDEKFVTLIAKILVQAEVSGEVKEIPMVLGLATTMVKGKIIYFACYNRFESDADISWIKTQSLEWMPLLFSANNAN